MRTYVSPIGFDTRRVTRPVINTGLGREDIVLLLRPGEEADDERAAQAVADVEQMVQEIEPAAECIVERVSIDSFEQTVHDCCAVFEAIPENRETIVTLGGGARDILLPLTIAAIVFAGQVDRALFYSDIDNTVCDWSLPTLTTQVPDRASDTFEAIVGSDDWRTLSSIADETGRSKSTVIRHVNDLEDAEVVESDTSGKVKRVRVSFSGELFWRSRAVTR